MSEAAKKHGVGARTREDARDIVAVIRSAAKIGHRIAANRDRPFQTAFRRLEEAIEACEVVLDEVTEQGGVEEIE